jgi:hypothetical protein
VHPARSSEVNLAFDLIYLDGLLTVYAFFSERDAQAIAERLRARDVSGALRLLQERLQPGIVDAVGSGMSKHVTIQSIPPPARSDSSSLTYAGRLVLKTAAAECADQAVTSVLEYLRAVDRGGADSFVTATQDKRDGVTLTIQFRRTVLIEAMKLVSKGQVPTPSALAKYRQQQKLAPGVSINSGFVRK